MNFKTSKSLRAISIGLLGGALIMLLLSFGCSSGSDDPPGNGGNDNGSTTDDHGNDRNSATPVTSGTPISGNIETGTDDDWFSIQVTPTHDLTTLTATTTGSTDTIGELYDSDGNQLAMDDDGGTNTNFNVSHNITATGIYYVRVVSSASATGMYSLTVTSTSSDHGNGRDSATMVTAGTAITGNIDPGTDEDYFSILLNESGTLRAVTTGNTNTMGTLYDSDGDELDTDDNSGMDENFNVSYQVTSGIHYVRVASSGTGTGMYSLTVTFEPDDHSDKIPGATPVTSGTAVTGNIEAGTDDDWFSIQVTPMNDLTTLTATTTGSTDTIGELYDSDGDQLAMDDNGGADTNFNVSHNITTTGTYYVRVLSSGSGTGMYSLTVTSTSSDYGNGRDSATPVTSGTAITGNIDPGTDEDWFSIQVTFNDITTLTATTTGSTDTIGELYDSDGDQLAMDDNGGTDTNFNVSYNITTTGTYYVRVLSSGSGTGMYSLTVTSTSSDYGNGRDSATMVTSGTAITGNIDPGTDEDWFSIQVTPTNDLTTLTATTTGSTDTIGELYDSDGDQLAMDDNGGTDTNFNVSHNITTTGTYYVRVLSKGSVTGMYSLTVTSTSSDYGNDRASATPVTSGTAITGNIDPGTDEDWFSIQVTGVGTLSAGTTNRAGTLDPIGHLYDSDGDQLAMNDDARRGILDFRFSHSITTAGTYYVRVTSFGTSMGAYTLTVTFIPDDHGNDRASATPVTSGTAITGNIDPDTDEDWFSIQVTPMNDLTTLTATTTGSTDTIGELYGSEGNQLAMDDDGGTDTNFDVSQNITTTGTYYVRVLSKGSATGMYSLTVTSTSSDHGNDRDSATPVTSGMVITGNIDPGTNEDWFSIQVPPTHDLTTLTATTTGSTDTIGELYDSEGNQLAMDDDGGTDTNFNVSYKIAATGTYYVRVVSKGSVTGMYSLTVTSTSSDHGNDRDSATMVTSGVAIKGDISLSGPEDEDYFSIEVNGAGTLAAGTTGNTDTVGHLYDSEENQLAMDDDGGTGLNFDLSYNITTPGTYYIKVSAFGIPMGYTLTVTFTPSDG